MLKLIQGRRNTNELERRMMKQQVKGAAEKTKGQLKEGRGI